ncbi:putative tetratricopeptide [Azoarcus sp. KH32C]|nr:putative tetratricopeptide [Azoarcus sp. KH32C]
MTKHPLCTQLLGHAAIVTALLGTGLAVAQTDTQPASNASTRLQAMEPDRTQLERRFESVGTLIEKSTAARQIESSGEAAAIEKRNNAKEIYGQAKSAYSAGDLAKASSLLSAASKMMFEAARLAAPESVTAKKVETDYRNKLESVNALLSAQRRIATEKNNKESQASSHQVEALIADAERKASAGQYANARTILEQAYLLAKASISSMRSGDTLVRSLNFANKEEEYHYEIDRNETHKMLVKVLLEDKLGGEAVSPRVSEFLTSAGSLRGEAEAAAKRGDFEAGIKLLEQSTGELVKAIRSAGIYIPG